jgi:hypothetical protein
VKEGLTLKRFTEVLENDFRNLVADGDDALNAADIGVHETMFGAKIRAQGAMQMMGMDLDGDGFATEDEMRRAFIYERRASGPNARLVSVVDQVVAGWLQHDRNGDRRIDWAEATDPTAVSPAGNRRAPIRVDRLSSRIDLILTIDQGTDGSVTLAEYMAAGEAYFRRLDSNGDKVLSEAEIAAGPSEAAAHEDLRPRAEEAAAPQPETPSQQQPSVATATPTPPAVQSDSPHAQLLGKRMREGLRLDALLMALEKDVRELAMNGGDTIRAGEVGDYEMMVIAMNRAKGAANIMRMDIDGDGFAVEEEIRKVLTFQQGLLGGSPALDAMRDKRIQEYLAVDKNGDRRVDWTEAVAQAAKVQAEERAERGAGKRELMLGLDPNGDGALTLAEYQTLGEAVFRGLDTDGDRVLSGTEAAAYRPDAPVAAGPQSAAEEAARVRVATVQPAGEAALAAAESVACVMPAASPEAEVVLLGVYDAEAISSVAIGTQDQTVETAALTIESGDKPLYVVIVSHTPIIWRLSGAVQRVERLVLVSNTGLAQEGVRTPIPLVGETGLQADRVTFLVRTDCLEYFKEAPSVAAAQAAALVRARTGKEPTTVAAQYKIGEFLVPSGAARSVARKGGPGFPLMVFPGAGTLRIERESGSMTISTGSDDPGSSLGRFNAGGVVEIDVTTVVASLPPEPYIVLPQEAGLVQLLQAGVLTRNSGGEYLIHKKTRYPAGLCGAHAVTFLLMRGVPEPDGNHCHAKVYSEESGLLLRGIE